MSGTTQVELDPCELQFIMLALAELSLRRPGWNYMLSTFAEKIGALESFQKFKVTSASRPDCKPEELSGLLEAAVHGFRSYQYGNVAPDLAKELADKIEEWLLAH